MQKISVVVPMYFEQENVQVCYDRIKKVLNNLSDMDHEMIFVNDGSTDRTLPLLKSIASVDHKVKIVSLSRNFGQQIAVTAGINRANGDAVVIMDADLQDAPEKIPSFIDKWKEGYLVVYAIRINRKENLFKRTSYALFYKIIRRLANIDIPLDSGDFCLMDRTVVKHLQAMPERTRLIRGLRSWVGFQQIGLKCERDRRYAGEVKNTFPKLLKMALDGIFSFSNMPLRLTALLGFITSTVSFAGGIISIVMKYTNNYTPPGWTSNIVVVFFLGGIQLIAIGLIGEYVARIYDEVKQRPPYITAEEVNFDDHDNLKAQNE